MRFIEAPGGTDAGHLAPLVLDALLEVLIHRGIVDRAELADVIAEHADDLDTSKMMIAKRNAAFVETLLDRLRRPPLGGIGCRPPP